VMQSPCAGAALDPPLWTVVPNKALSLSLSLSLGPGLTSKVCALLFNTVVPNSKLCDTVASLAPGFPQWFLSFGNQTQNSRVAGASPATSPSGDLITMMGSGATPRARVCVCVLLQYQSVCVYYCSTYYMCVLQSCSRGGGGGWRVVDN